MTDTDTSLEDIRREIDAIDDGIVDLLVRRAAAQGRVKSLKGASGSLAVSPFRPSREAIVLRRVIARSQGRVPAGLLVRLWRSILSASTLSQAPVELLVSRTVASDCGLQRLLAVHFGEMKQSVVDDEVSVLAASASTPGNLGVTRASGWQDAFLAGAAGNARVIGVLPTMVNDEIPDLLLWGHASTEPTGKDCTLLVTRQKLAAKAKWSSASDNHVLSCLSGFLDEAALRGMGIGLGASARAAGRFPDQIEGM